MEFELMVNEGCLQGCPNRMLHEYINIDKNVIINDDICLSICYASSFCYPIIAKYPIQSLVIGTHIFPWDIYKYEQIGIKNFKFVGRDGYSNFNEYLEGFFIYLKGVDNINNIKNDSMSAFLHHLGNSPVLRLIKVKDYKKYLPNIKHFIKKGDLCISKCAIECRYCYKCAEKIQKVFDKKQKKQRKSTMPFCVMSK